MQLFADAWNNPHFTRYEIPGVDLNRVLAKEYGLVIEQIHLDHLRQVATSIEAGQYPDRNGKIHHRGEGQPIFHIVHSVAGSEKQLRNQWFIVHETEKPEPLRIVPFEEMARRHRLPRYLEVYIQRHLGIKLSRNDSSEPRRQPSRGCHLRHNELNYFPSLEANC
ncbi:hypothetical protein FHU41_001220 [Psychromicrobium silvestre]|uniref:Uncharacterized protein n=1 Tax=Psychromicrobium silvestre TaxID=1645614 RepID=A0A7Y9S5M8_9MICC|nr:hypothetical protein [Psychromicrobium silvestre]NYE94999.1 hypothetical protein [Psychromicrobium silvestre]